MQIRRGVDRPMSCQQLGRDEPLKLQKVSDMLLPHLTPIGREVCFWKGIVGSSPGEKSASFGTAEQESVWTRDL